jgi:uncharacterized surface protein with fasciclin (FAS1) repeats
MEGIPTMRKLIAAATMALLAVAMMAVPATAKGDRAPGDVTLYEILETTPALSTLKFAVDTAGLDGAFKQTDDQLTVFAPTNAAFAKAATELGFEGDVLALAGYLIDQGLLDDVLLYHVTDGRRFSNSVVNKNNVKAIDTLLGAPIYSTPGLMVVDASAATSNANIVPGLFDISASNGVAHVIDNVLVPLP